MMRYAWFLLALPVLDAPPVVWNASPNYTASNREWTYDIDSIVIHTTEGSDTNGDGYYAECYTQAINWFKNSSAGASAHYVIAPWGEITQMVADDDIAWHAAYYNSRSIGIECAGFAGSPSTWTPELLAALTQLVAWLAEKYGVPLVHPDDDANDWGGWYGGTGILGHHQTQTSGSAAAAAYGVRTDPGPYFPWGSFMAGVIQTLAPGAPSNLRAEPGLDSAVLSWDAPAGADGYYVDLARSPEDLDSMTGTFQNWNVTDTSATWTGLEPGATYYWRVWAYNGYGGTHGYPAGPFATGTATISEPESGGGGGSGGGCGMVGLEALLLLALLYFRRK